MTPMLARTNHEAHLYMDLRPCACGATAFDRASSVVLLPDGDLGSRYAGTCACGREREFLFRLPAQVELPTAGARYGDAGPSQLLDAGEWLWVADRYAQAVPADPHTLPASARATARARLAQALAAVDEVLKFAGTDPAVPPDAFWTGRGRAVRDREPGRFTVARLRAVHDAYARVLRQMDGAGGH
ncbi:hypothetical protein [Polymorphospora lycopeni]|uniref:Uncharacterized protein n=1 Tax=Polymorphospora lycopeni TaxID=3140240 RepID=A0ABV5D0X6_9ACTN